MSTIGERTVSSMLEQRRAEVRRRQKWQDRKDIAKGAGCVVLAIAAVLGAIFGVVYLVTLAIRLGWGP